ncbi:ATP-binding protein [Rugamonas rubra]|uniref:AAA domain-containing protein n=1 Tax=Rugamonas rubra TaxID=758825 RepID=A0A1I4UEV7_9BURK|nr:ATP-binding protein [Rugamonas rubra]SFM87243.1 AAA domain-containing protein [Rugamonas rubra]
MMGETTIQAWYEASPVLEYAGNPLIEAMPPIMSEEDAAERLSNFPPFPDDERELPKEIRLHCINRISHLVQPLPIHLELEAVVSSIIRSGYMGRNPMDAATWRHLHALSQRSTSPASTFNSTASTFSLVGLSGMGKTTALKSVLRLLPQVIKHTRYQGRDLIHTQIVWLKLECPHNGSLAGLCQDFFRAVDAALGDDIHAHYYKSKRNEADLIPMMRQVAATYFIGAIFIDELQHLQVAKATGKVEMLNFFVNLINSIGVPVVFIGTNSMVQLFSHIVRNARRVSGQGIYDFKQPTEEDETWDLLLNTMWEYQWVENPTPLTDELKATIYDLTQGVTDFLSKLMILGQRYAIQSGKERLDEQVFVHIASTKMKLLQPAIAALRSKDPKQMAMFEDLLPVDAQMAEMMLDQLHVIPSNLSVLRAKQARLLSAVTGKDTLQKSLPKPMRAPDAKKEKGAVSQPSQHGAITKSGSSRSIPLSARLTNPTSVVDGLREAGWLVSDPCEFEPYYRAA